uniref:Uncharacterized protein n=1 Tax=Anguilla anguilla TaxID=7936 RepID=A0A0E9TER7_ANGAN
MLASCLERCAGRSRFTEDVINV